MIKIWNLKRQHLPAYCDIYLILSFPFMPNGVFFAESKTYKLKWNSNQSLVTLVEYHVSPRCYCIVHCQSSELLNLCLLNKKCLSEHGQHISSFFLLTLTS